MLAKSVIQLWMAGGPTQTDTWDPKPNAGEDFTGPLRRPVATNVTGSQIGAANFTIGLALRAHCPSQ